MTEKRITRSKNIVPLGLAFACLIFLIIYTYAYFAKVPYLGFSIEFSDTTISKIFTTGKNPGLLLAGDQIISIGQKRFDSEAYSNVTSPTFPDLQAGQITRITFRRDNQQASIDWVVPGINPNELVSRLTDIWFLPYVFWLFGVLTIVLIRPRDTRWRLMVEFFFVCALWLGAGFASYARIWYSSLSMRALTWILVAVSLHFHWQFPKPLFQPGSIYRYLLYFFAGLLAFLELTRQLPAGSYLVGISIAVAGSLGLMLYHLFFFIQKRRRSHLLLVGVVIFLILSVQLNTVFYSQLAYNFPTKITLLLTPLLPAAYFYAVYSTHLGGLEFRLNRLMSLVTFILPFFVLSGLMITSIRLMNDPNLLVLVSMIMMFITVTSGAVLYPPYQKWFERTFLGLPQISNDLLARYTALLSDNLETRNVARVLDELVFPSLMIRQAVVFRCRDNNFSSDQTLYSVILQKGIYQQDLQKAQEFCLQEAPVLKENSIQPNWPTIPWVKAAFPLQVGTERIGLCLLGRRDPDDYYSPSESPLLQALMDQTALAIVHVEQASSLRAFHQADIQRQEEERKRLARILHDEVLGHLAVIAQKSDQLQLDKNFHESYLKLVENIRDMITGLRPSTLNFGLTAALEECLDNFLGNRNQIPIEPLILLDIHGDSLLRFPSEIELHLFRIAQQACFNAIQHAQAKTVKVTAEFYPNRVMLRIEDDGCGFEASLPTDLAKLLANRQFGLVGMVERAALIDAELSLRSSPGAGTIVQVSWENPNQAYN